AARASIFCVSAPVRLPACAASGRTNRNNHRGLAGRPAFGWSGLRKLRKIPGEREIFHLFVLAKSALKFPMTTNQNDQKPIIGLTTYRKVAAQATPLPLMALMPSYIEAVAAAGGVPILIPLGLDEDALRI